MAYARDVYTATASQTDFVITFPYISNSHVLVYDAGTLKTVTTDYTLPDATTVRFNSGISEGSTVVIQRSTSASTRLVAYTAGPLLTDDLNNDSLQAFYLAQESEDSSDVTMGLDSATSSVWDAESRRITGVGAPTAGSDAVTLAYADATYLGTPSAQLSLNKIINGGFDIWQRGTSFSAGDETTADRWYLYFGTGAAATLSRVAFTIGQTDVPGEPTYHLRLNRTTAGSAFSSVEQYVESVRTFAGQECTMSFWAKADGAFNLDARLEQHFGTGGSSQVNTTAETFALTTSWQKFTYTITPASISGKTIAGGDDKLSAGFVWNETEGATGQIDIAQVQLEAGPAATAFASRPISMELAFCQRYLPVYNYSGGQNVCPGQASSTTGGWAQFPFVVQPRVAPTGITISAAGDFRMTNAAYTGLTVTALTFNSSSLLMADLSITVASGAVAGDALLLYGDSSGQILFTGCEL